MLRGGGAWRSAGPDAAAGRLAASSEGFSFAKAVTAASASAKPLRANLIRLQFIRHNLPWNAIDKRATGF